MNQAKTDLEEFCKIADGPILPLPWMNQALSNPRKMQKDPILESS